MSGPRIHEIGPDAFKLLKGRQATKVSADVGLGSAMYVERLNKDIIWAYLDPETVDIRSEEDLDRIDDNYFDLFIVLVI